MEETNVTGEANGQTLGRPLKVAPLGEEQADTGYDDSIRAQGRVQWSNRIKSKWWRPKHLEEGRCPTLYLT